MPPTALAGTWARISGLRQASSAYSTAVGAWAYATETPIKTAAQALNTMVLQFSVMMRQSPFGRDADSRGVPRASAANVFNVGSQCSKIDSGGDEPRIPERY
jgi:hypothetical protein